MKLCNLLEVLPRFDAIEIDTGSGCVFRGLVEDVEDRVSNDVLFGDVIAMMTSYLRAHYSYGLHVIVRAYQAK